TLDLSVLCGRATLVEIMTDEHEHIGVKHLEALNLPADVRRLVIRTTNSRLWEEGHTTFYEDYIALASDGAQWVVDRGIGLVGIDYLSIAPFTALVETHEILLSAKVIPVEGLDLRGVPVGEYDLYCLPLNITGRDGAPCRTILIETA
ncbi:MAG TPA: cyclase family protein, partial [Aggregatilineales bacterium]|nr:cyclase family protein [Aggregatilineales bacterium]